MKRNSRLSLGLHALGHIAAEPDRTHTSAEIAAHVGTNPVVVRRVLGKLRDASLLRSEKGFGGGWRLARAAESITLADVYVALEERLMAPEVDASESNCSIEHAVRERVSKVMEDIERSLIDRLAETTILDVHGAERHSSG